MTDETDGGRGRGHRGTMVAIAAGVLAVLVVGGVFVLVGRRSPAQRTPVAAATHRTVPASAGSVGASPTPDAKPTRSHAPHRSPSDHHADHSRRASAGHHTKRCGLGANLVPACGALWGVSPGNTTVTALENLTGRKFDLVQLWHGINQDNLPRPKERALARQGHILHYNLASRRFGSADKPSISYASIIAGKLDAQIARQARGFAKFGKPVFITFDHEADNKARRAHGTPKQFAAAWRHIHDIYQHNGAHNVVWVWVVTGSKGNFPILPSLYPGNAYVDWISWEAENGAGWCGSGNVSTSRSRSFAEMVRPFEHWLATTGKAKGIDPAKPYMITGMGTILFPGDPGLSAGWYRKVPEVLRKNPRIKAVQLWNDGFKSSCNFRITATDLIAKAFAKAGMDPYVNPKH